MIDINLIREDAKAVERALLKRMDQVDLAPLLAWDAERRGLINDADALKARRNTVSTAIPKMNKAGEDTTSLISEMKTVSEHIKALDARRSVLDGQIGEFLAGLPNIPDDDVSAGGKENNKVIRSWGDKPVFSAQPRDHVALVTSLGLVDFERGVKMGGNGYWLYRGWGARLEWAIINHFVQTHLADGYEFMLPPHVLTYDCGFTAGQFPKFEDDVFPVERDDNGRVAHFLLPTAETALVNLYRDEILAEDRLPLKFFAYTPCYRREAGSYRTEERGTVRGHQFNKVEMFQYTTPEDSDRALEELLGKAEKLVQDMGLHYQVTKLAARDCSAAMAKTFDVEVWFPSQGNFQEVSSVSNARDYQARRGSMRFKRTDTGKNEFVHTLNGSGLATSRLLPAICEQHQRPDGTIRLPEFLQDALGVKELKPQAMEP